MSINNVCSVGIIGCGWLGRVLAEQLITKGYVVKATVRDNKKKETLLASNIDCEILSVPEDAKSSHNVFSQETLVIAITPGFKRNKTDYASNIASIVKAAEASNVNKIILVSSTGIYQDLTGDVNEYSAVHNITASTSAKTTLLVEAESAVLNFSKKGLVLRLAGLVAEDRKPGKFLAGKTDLAGGEQPVNLIHRDDCVALLIKLIEQKNDVLEQQIFIGVSQTNANKKEFYTAAANALNLIPPSFNNMPDEYVSKDNHSLITRKVYGIKTREWLNYQYKYDDLLTWLNDKS